MEFKDKSGLYVIGEGKDKPETIQSGKYIASSVYVEIGKMA